MTAQGHELIVKIFRQWHYIEADDPTKTKCGIDVTARDLKADVNHRPVDCPRCRT